MLGIQKWKIRSIRGKGEFHLTALVVTKASKIGIHTGERDNLKYLYITKLEE